MPEVNWTAAERKNFYRMARAAFWTLLVVLALLFFFKIVEVPGWMAPWLWLVYLIAIWVPVYKIIRARWGA